MMRFLARGAQRFKACMCIALVVNLHVWVAGCGTQPQGLGVRLLTGPFTLSLGPGDALTKAVAGSRYNGASSLTIDPVTGAFSIDHADPGVQLRGIVAAADGRRPQVVRLELESDGRTVTITFDAAQRIDRMSTSTGLTWERPASWVGRTPAPGADDLERIMATNFELLDYANSLDEAILRGEPLPSAPGEQQPPPPVSDDVTAKTAQADQDIGGTLAAILLFIGIDFTLRTAIGFWPVTVWLLQVAVATGVTVALTGVTLPDLSGLLGGLFGDGSNGDDPNSEGPPDEPPPPSSTTQALLRVINTRSDGAPIWTVALIDGQGTTGDDLLDGQAIPAGASRDFAIAPGTKEVTLQIPLSAGCSLEFTTESVTFEAEMLVEVTLSDSDQGTAVPDGCAG